MSLINFNIPISTEKSTTDQLEKLLDAAIEVCAIYGKDIDKRSVVKDGCVYSFRINLEDAYSNKYDGMQIVAFDDRISKEKSFEIKVFFKLRMLDVSNRFMPPRDEKEFFLKIFKDMEILTKDESIIKDIIE